MRSVQKYKELWDGVLYNMGTKELVEFRTGRVCRQIGPNRCFITYKYGTIPCPRDGDGELMCISKSVMGGYVIISERLALLDEVEINH